MRATFLFLGFRNARVLARVGKGGRGLVSGSVKDTQHFVDFGLSKVMLRIMPSPSLTKIT